MKSLILGSLLAWAASAASWDGTHGNVTIHTTEFFGVKPATIVEVSSSDPTVSYFLVTAFIEKQDGLRTATHVLIVQANPVPSKPQAAVFDLRSSDIDSIIVEECHVGQRQVFGRPATR